MNPIKQARKARNLSQSDLAKNVSATQATISRLETGVFSGVNSTVIKRVCKFLDIEIPIPKPRTKKYKLVELIQEPSPFPDYTDLPSPLPHSFLGRYGVGI